MEKIKEFITVITGDGYGDGWGSGDGYGDGDGSGSGGGDGSGDGYGDGDGSGSGYGYGYGYGSGIKNIKGLNVYIIDDIQTIITSLRNNVAKGFILNNDLTLIPTYIVKQNNLFAHGETLKKAISDLRNKLFEGLSEVERLAEFWKSFNYNDKYTGHLFFDWHNKLTKSCLIGRETFVKNSNINLDEKYTVDEFIKITENNYGGEIIKRLRLK